MRYLLPCSYFLFVLLLRESHSKVNVPWGYSGRLDANRWPRDFEQCNGIQQSPIRIVPTHVVHNPFLRNLSINRYSSMGGYVLSMYNNGKSVQVRLSQGAYIKGGGLNGRYNIAQFHFHWGSKHTRGSEHVINNRRYPMEVHLVHYAKKYKSLESAMTKPDGLAVIGILFEIVDKDNPNLEPIVSKLRHIPVQGQSVMIKKFNLISMLPDDSTKYYRYHGSLTTPPCFESVTWSVLHNPINISLRQLNEFQSLQKKPKKSVLQPKVKSLILKDIFERSESLIIVDNFRPLQLLNGRIVYANFVTDALIRESRLSMSTKSTLSQTHVVVSLVLISILFIGRFK